MTSLVYGFIRAGQDGWADSLTIASFAAALVLLGSFVRIQRQLNTDGPFFPLIQPGQVVVATKGVTGADYNPTWTIDVAGAGG